MKPILKAITGLCGLAAVAVITLWRSSSPNSVDMPSGHIDSALADQIVLTEPQVAIAKPQFGRSAAALDQTSIAPSFPPEDPDEIVDWARNNPESALAWMLNAAASDQRDAVAEIVCPQVAEAEPTRAVQLAETYASATSVLHENMVQQWAEQDVDAAYSYATNKPAGDPRDRLLSRVAFVLAKTDPARAAQIVAEEMFAGGLQDEAAMSVIHQWGLRDSDAAAAWAERFPNGAVRDRALRELQSARTSTLRQGFEAPAL